MEQILRRLCVVGLVLAATTFTEQAAPPANDNFANRTILSGRTAVFDGNVAEATFDFEDPIANIIYGTSGSIWWSWTSPVTGFAVVTMPNGAAPRLVSSALAVFAGDSTAGYGTRLAWMEVRPGSDTFFNVTAGQSYNLGLAGDAGTNVIDHFQLHADENLIFLSQPQAQTVHSGDSVFFLALSPGSLAGSMQWQLNGVDLPGKTAPTLALHNLSSTNAGDYRVLAKRTNSASVLVTSTSDTARLIVEGEEVRPTLRLIPNAAPSSRFKLTLTGEANQSYWIEQTADLTNWSSLRSIGKYSFQGFTEFPLEENNLLYLNPVTARGPLLFRVVRFGDASQWCIANLKSLEFAKFRAMVDKQRNDGSSMVAEDVHAYFDSPPQCPAGGVYTYGNYGPSGQKAQCSIPWPHPLTSGSSKFGIRKWA